MRALIVLAFLVASGAGADGADLCPVIAVPDADHVVIRFQGVPVDVPLAYVDVPSAAPARAACQQRLSKMLTGRKVTMVFRPSFGTDVDGAARVQILLGNDYVNSILVADGYARFRPGVHSDSDYDDPVRKAQEHAQAGKLGIWSHEGPWADAPAVAETPAATPPSEQVTALKTLAPTPAESDDAGAKPATPATPATPAATVVPAAAASTPGHYPGPFCSELDSKYYYPSGHHGVATINPQRLIFYADEAAAQKAGKSLSPQVELDAMPSDASEASADMVYAKGKLLYTQAIDVGNNSNRDALYARAFVILSAAMRSYSTLVEAHPNDDALAEKLRECMQFRYGSLKQRRFE